MNHQRPTDQSVPMTFDDGFQIPLPFAFQMLHKKKNVQPNVDKDKDKDKDKDDDEAEDAEDADDNDEDADEGEDADDNDEDADEAEDNDADHDPFGRYFMYNGKNVAQMLDQIRISIDCLTTSMIKLNHHLERKK